MILSVKDISTLEPGEYEVEFVREQDRNVANGAQAGTPSPRRLSCCILRVVATGDEVEDTSRSSLTRREELGQRFIAVVREGERFAGFRPVGAPAPVPAEASSS